MSAQETRTSTKTFGVSSRIGHDSSKFYARRIYQRNDTHPSEHKPERPVPAGTLNNVYCKSSEQMDELPDNSVHLMVTSPPYNVGKEYDEDLSLNEYAELLERVFKDTYRVLVHGGRACVNVANVGRKPYIPLNALISTLMIDIGYLMRGEIIWNKSASAGVSCAWGSWKSPSNPVLRDVHEYILVFSKGSYRRSNANGIATIARDEFLDGTKSVWAFPAESARRVGHPSPFPIELPSRLIQLYTFAGDIVLDPFIGSGSTALASVQAKRDWIGYDTSTEYCELTRKRVSEWHANESASDSTV